MTRLRIRTALPALLLTTALLAPLRADGGLASIVADDLRTWLTYLASDELEGRNTYSAGLGLAAGYIQSHLENWGVEPAGDQGGYLQTVRVLGVQTTSRSSVRVRVGREERTFADGADVTFPRNMGVARTFTLDRVQFAGYGLDAPASDRMDYRGLDVKGAAVVWLGVSGPANLDGSQRRLLAGRGRYAVEQKGALASIGPRASEAGRPATTTNRTAASVDFTTVQRLDHEVAPVITVSEEVLTFVFSRAPRSYADLKRRADAREDLEPLSLDSVSLTFVIDVDYAIVREQRTQNVVGIVRGGDPELNQTYVAFGAHYDHVGYNENQLREGGGPAPGRITPGATDDRVWNGADDDGSGTVALMALARAFAEAPRPKRSMLFVWHAGEERGLLGSRYFVDHPSVPLDAIVSQLNADMIGRNRDDKPSESDTVYLVGSDRISTELHEINREANRALPSPLTLNYEMNDPADPEQLYFRSDHYSYAAQGIPVIFFFTGLHPDYHANTDHVSRIEFAKLTRVTQLIYETGLRLANLDRAPVRDNLGPRAGKGTK